MPELNIEEKIQEALKRKSFKDNKAEYLGLTLIFCLMLFITFVIAYFLPLVAIFVFVLIDIPLIMGYKHFIWFGPASGETLIEGFKISMLCGYLNFISYIKIFIATNLRAFLWSIGSFFITTFAGGFVLEGIYGNEINEILNRFNEQGSSQEILDAFMNNEHLKNGLLVCEIASFIVACVVFLLLKLTRALLPYTSFLRLTSLEGKTMDGVITYNKKVIKTKPAKYYLTSLAYHLLYLIPIGLTVGVYFLLGLDPKYSSTTKDLMSALTFFIAMFPAILFIELNYRNFCIEVNQEYIKQHKKMLDDALNDLE